MQLAFHSYHENVQLGRLIGREIHDMVTDRWFWFILGIALLLVGLTALMVIFPPAPTVDSGGAETMPIPYGLM